MELQRSCFTIVHNPNHVLTPWGRFRLRYIPIPPPHPTTTPGVQGVAYIGIDWSINTRRCNHIMMIYSPIMCNNIGSGRYMLSIAKKITQQLKLVCATAHAVCKAVNQRNAVVAAISLRIVRLRCVCNSSLRLCEFPRPSYLLHVPNRCKSSSHRGSSCSTGLPAVDRPRMGILQRRRRRYFANMRRVVDSHGLGANGCLLLLVRLCGFRCGRHRPTQ